jgi:hypothetical protein
MAQLTWKNVDAPNFSGVSAALSGAGDALNRGFQASRQAIDGFEKDQTQSESARLMAAAMGVKDPAQLASIIGQFNPSYLSPDALKFAGGRPQDLATLAQTGAATAQTNAVTDYTKQATPLRVEGLRLGNQSQTIQNAQAGTNLTQDIWKNKNAQNEYAAKPAWDLEAGQIRQAMASGDPLLMAEARARMSSPDVLAKASAAGIKDVGAFITSSTADATAGVGLRDSIATLGEKEKALAIKNGIEAQMTTALQAYATPTAALRAIQDNPNIHPDIKKGVADRIQASPTLWAPAASEAEVLAEGVNRARSQTGPSAAPSQAQTQSQSRPPLDFFTSAAKAQGLEVTSSFRGPNDPLTLANPNSAHAQNRAFDLRARTAADADTAIEKQRQIFASQGMVEGRDYKIIDEVRNPSAHATGPHVHVELTPEGERRQATPGNASDRVTQVLGRVNTPIAPPNLSGSNGAALATAASAGNFTPGISTNSVDALLTEDRNVRSTLQAAGDMNRIDRAFEPAAPIIEAFNNRPEKASTVSEVAARIHKDIGGDSSEPGMFTRGRLTPGIINDELNRVMSKFGVDADMAGVLLKSAVKFEDGWIRSDGRSIDRDKVDQYVSRFIEKDGSGKGKPRSDALNAVRQKAAIEKQVTDGQALLDNAKQEWLAAQGARDRGNTRVDVEAARAKYEKVQKALTATAARLAKNPNLTVFTQSNTGR